MATLKRILLGRPLATEEAGHQLLPKFLALPVFASDALSSNAYATEEILHVLILAGTGALPRALPISAAVILLMLIVVSSYRQTVRAYPRGGGGYLVTKENVGTIASLTAAGALLAAYVLTVAVSMAAGAFAVASFIPTLLPHRVGIALVFLVLITIMNLRGAKESGVLFAVPTYAFILSILAMVATGVARCVLASCPSVDTSDLHFAGAEPAQALTLFLLLRAFSSGATALTGVEAIADGVAAFRGNRPSVQARNAATTLGALFVLSSSMFFGITFLATQMGVTPAENKSVVAQIADATFGGGAGFVIVQITTAAILFLAANTAYQDFPRLSSILAKDRFMPRQLINRGDRLVFSNGIIALGILSAVLIVIFDAAVTRLIPLYLVGVFTTFTLAQTGMVLRWRRGRDANWLRNALFNGIGAAVTGLVLIVVVATKFADGAWMMIAAVPLIVVGMVVVNWHYQSVARQLRVPETRPRAIAGTRAIVLVARVHLAALRAVGYARAMRPLEVRAVHVGRGTDAETVRAEWGEHRIPVPLDVLEGDPDDFVDPIRHYVRSKAGAEDEVVTVVIPELYRRYGWRQFVGRPRALLLKTAMLFEPRVVVTDIPTLAPGEPATVRYAIAPARIIAIVLVSAVHNATLRALEYGRSLSPFELRAVTFNVEPEETERVLRDWGRMVGDIALEAIDSPYREVTRPLVRYARQLRDQNPDTIVAVILPEFVVKRWWHQFLHNQTALAIKASLLFEPGVVVTSIPFHLD